MTALVMWVAALGKAIQVITEPAMPERLFWLAVLEAELVLGMSVLLGRRLRWVWIGASLLFLALAGIAGY